MNTKQSKLSLCLCTLMAAAALSLSACSTTGQTENQLSSSVQPFGPLNQSLEQYQNLYGSASNQDRFSALILVSRSLIASGDLDKATEFANKLLSEAKTPLEIAESAIVQGMLDFRGGKNESAINKLKSVDVSVLPKQAASYYYVLNSNANLKVYQQQHNIENALIAYDNQRSLLSLVSNPADRLTVMGRCVKILSMLDASTLSAKLSQANDTIDKGFFEYALISQSQSSTLKEDAYSQFRSKYVGHPLIELLDAENLGGSAAPSANVTSVVGKATYEKRAVTATSTAPEALFKLQDGDKVAVLLPLSGRFAANVGNPARLGVLAALKDNDSKLKVAFYDTNKINISEIVSKISNDGTKLVIGPILKPEVTAFNASGIKIPSIALNTSENRPVNQWYFDLGPNYEGAIAAAKIYADGHQKPVVIASAADESARRAVAGFDSTLLNAGIKAVQCNYNDPAKLNAAITTCPLSQADSVYVNAPVIDAVNIKALLPSSLAVYLTDKSFIGVNNSAQELALKGSKLGDMPWLLTDSQLKDSFMQSLPKADNMVQRIFAAAYDSIGFALNINELAADKEDVLHGLSGDISLGKDGLIENSPMWVELGAVRK